MYKISPDHKHIVSKMVMPSFLTAPSAISELENESVTVKVSNIPLKATNAYLSELFLEVGEIETVTFIPHQPELSLPSKKALVKFTTRQAAEQALKLNGRIYEDRHIQVEEIVNKPNYDCTVIVNNISKTATEERLWKLFSKFGGVKSINVKLGEEDTLRAIVIFETKEARRLATKEHMTLAGKVLKVVKRVNPEKKEKKVKKKLEQIRQAQESFVNEVEGEDWDMNSIEAQDVNFKNIRTYKSKKKQKHWMEEIMGKRKPKLTKEMGSVAAEARQAKKKKKLDRERKEKENKEKVKRIKIKIKKI